MDATIPIDATRLAPRAPTEVDLGRVVVEHLRREGWDVYQEVVYARGRADVVGVRSSLVWIVEVKRTINFALFSQADAWVREGCGHLVSVAVPVARRQRAARALARRMLSALGVGLLEVGLDAVEAPLVPRLRRRAPRAGAMLSCLRPEMRSAAPAGTNGGGFWTPFRTTCRRALELLEEHPGLTTSELLAALRAEEPVGPGMRAALVDRLVAGEVAGVVSRGARPVRWYPADRAPTEPGSLFPLPGEAGPDPSPGPGVGRASAPP